jgi:alpha-N-arabinofuranosidase
VLTNRNLGDYMIQGAGHADIVKDENNQWWMVHLAFRQIHKWKPYHHLGREVFLEPIYWTEDDWFTVGTDGTSRASYQVESNTCIMYPDVQYPAYKWNVNKEEACYLRNPDYHNYQFISNHEFSLKGTLDHLSGTGNVTFLGMRQKEFQVIAEVDIDTSTMLQGQQAGITVYMNEGSHYDLFVTKEDGYSEVSCMLYVGYMPVIMDKLRVTNKDVMLKVDAETEEYKFFCKNDQEEYTLLGHAETKYLSSEVAGGFTGVIIAAYSIANQENQSEFVHFRTI